MDIKYWMLLFAFTGTVLCSIAVAQDGHSVVGKVNVFIGTAGDHGQLDPAATVPFGLVKPGPDTDPGNHSGYDFNAGRIYGFSHNRISGVGCKGTGGNIRIKPGVGMPSAASEPFIKTSEKAGPGFYQVDFKSGLKAELTASNQTAFHRYTFPASPSGYILVDLTASFDSLVGQSFKELDPQNICGEVSAKTVCSYGVYKQFFYLHSDKKWNFLQNDKGRLYLSFTTGESEIVNITVTLSSISIEQAIEDAKKDVVGRSFDNVKRDASQLWDKLLSKVTVKGKPEYETLFYTHLYHSYLSPFNTTSISSNHYKGTDNNLYKADHYTHYDSWSLWDTYRNKFPLISLLEPGYMRDFSLSLMDLYRTGKEGWAGMHEPAPTVRTEHAIITLLDAYYKNIITLDDVVGKGLYLNLVKEAENYPLKTPDNQLESAYDHWALSKWAAILSKEEDVFRYRQKAMEYERAWNANFKQVTDRFDIVHEDHLYEGTLWQYRWAVPFDIEGISQRLLPADTFNAQLRFFFANNLYNPGNEPDINVPFLFNKTGLPYLSQYWVNQILTKDFTNDYATHNKRVKPEIRKVFTASPDGFLSEMDDDDGTMAAWYVWASMGLYPLTVGIPEYEITTPVFKKVTMRLADGKTFSIICRHFSDKNIYIQAMRFNGELLKGTVLQHREIIQGGVLELELGPKPIIKPA